MMQAIMAHMVVLGPKESRTHEIQGRLGDMVEEILAILYGASFARSR